VSGPPTRRGAVGTKAQLGLAKEIPVGAERLLAQLVRRGLAEHHLKAAASLVLALEEWAAGGVGSARVCACGCGRSLEGRRANAVYFDGACRVRAHRARRKVVRPDGWTQADVTVTGAPNGLREAA
jgi:hypothetical protein